MVKVTITKTCSENLAVLAIKRLILSDWLNFKMHNDQTVQKELNGSIKLPVEILWEGVGDLSYPK